MIIGYVLYTIDHRLQNTRCSGDVITPTDVRIAGKGMDLKDYALITSLMRMEQIK